MVPSRRRRWARRSVPSSTPRPTWHDAVRRDHPTGAPVSEPHKTDARMNEARMNVQNPDELPEPPRRRLWFRKKRYLLSILSVAVSYTHLRAHETDSYLVCRLLLEKKKKKTT